MTDERTTLERLRNLLEPPDGAYDRLLTRRERRRRGRQITAGAVALALTAAGVFGAFQLGRTTARPGDGGGAGTSAAVVPDVAAIECADAGATVTREVRPQANGVHLEVTNPGDSALMFEVTQPERGGFAERAEPGTSTFITSDLAPGTYTVKCYPESELDPSRLEGAPLTVTDQDGVWSDIAVTCPEGQEPQTGVLDYPEGVSGEEGTPEEIARRHLGNTVQDGDEVRRAGYQAADNPYVVVVRGGVNVAQVSLIAVIESGYIVQTTTTCEGGSLPPEG